MVRERYVDEGAGNPRALLMVREEAGEQLTNVVFGVGRTGSELSRCHLSL